MELYKKHRPKTFKNVVGQDLAVKVLEKKIDKENLPHTILFSGPSGCGKTTLARIVRRELKCGSHDFCEMNCADFRGIDEVRKIRSRMPQVPIKGSCRIWLIDEAHKLSNDAQNALLKMLEDTPSHVYFMLASSEPNKLIKALRNRCTEIVIKLLKDEEMERVLKRVLKKEHIKIPQKVISKIIEYSLGSARKALVFLDAVIEQESSKDMMNVLEEVSVQTPAIALARLLLNPKAKWGKVAIILKGIAKEDPEGVRYLVLSYMRSVLLGGGPLSDRAFSVINSFQDNFYDSKNAGLAAACYEIVGMSK